MTTRRLRLLVVCAAAAGALSACGTPAVVKPASNPLPGLKSDVQRAQQAVNQVQAPGAPSTGATITF
ncbi:MAG: hypothetical protein ACRDLP_09195 [Solirubrobacteraceae bacterium]